MKQTPILRILSLATFTAFLLAPTARAASRTWDGSEANANWNTALNWTVSGAPGSTSALAAGTTNFDVATFNAAIANTWGDSAVNPVVLDAAIQNLGGISFTGAAGNFFVGSTAGNGLRLAGGYGNNTNAYVVPQVIQILSGLTSTNAVETVNAPLSIYSTTNYAYVYTFANYSASGSGVGAGTLNLGGTINGGSSGNLTIQLNGTNTNANTISGVISNGTATSLLINKQEAGTWVLTGANTYTGGTTIGAGTLQVSGASGAIALSGTAMALNGGTLVVDNTTAAGGNNNARIADTQAIQLNGGSLLYKGSDASNSTETVGALTATSAFGSTSAITVNYGGTNTATLTAASLAHTVGNPTVLVNGTDLGKDATSTASVGRVILTSAPTLTGNTTALTSGINAGAQDTKIVPYLVGEATATTGGLGTSTGTANTFLTYTATGGLRPLNPTDEFTNNLVNAGDNTYITSATSSGIGGAAAINSLVINGGDLTIDDGDTLTNTSGALLFASSNKIKPSGTTGTLAFGSAEAMITINSGVTAEITAPMTGTGTVTLGGAGTMLVNGAKSFAGLGGSAALNLNAGSALTVGSNNASTAYSGILSGTGSITKIGSGTLTIGNSSNSNSTNDDFLYSGDINVNAGKITVVNFGNIYTNSKLTISGGTFDVQGVTAVSSLFGTTGTLTSGAGSSRSFFINYTGSDPSAGFTGNINGLISIIGAGSGNLTFGTVGGTASLANTGTGRMTATAVTSASSGISVFEPFGSIKLTGTTGRISGGGNTAIVGGTLIVAPSGSGAAVTVSGQDNAVTGTTAASNISFSKGSSLQLDKGANTSLVYTLGSTSSTSSSTNGLLNRGGPGTLVIDALGSSGELGGNTRLVVLKGATQGNVLPVTTNGLFTASAVVVSNETDSTHRADFLTYSGTGTASDTGFVKATYSLTDTFAGSTNTSSVKITTDQTISSATSAFALRNDATITINSGQTLTLGNPIAGTATGTQTPTTGLILNGGTIAGPGTLALGASEANIYTSDGNGTIGAVISGAGVGFSGNSQYSGTKLHSIVKFGNGTLYLTGANTYTGATTLNQGALDVGTISANALPTNSNLEFHGGVLQGNGSFVRALGAGNNQVTWNGVNGTASQSSGGFAARGGDLTVALGGIATPTALTWGLYGAGNTNVNFITDDGVKSGMLIFGSNTSDSQVDFKNNIDLGMASLPKTTNSGVAADSTLPSALYYRTVYVNQGTGTDSAKLSGVISSTVPHGLIKDGAGKLILTGANTYTGDTVVARGSLFINGNQAASTGLLTVNSGATLGGLGTIGGAALISAGASLTPGSYVSGASQNYGVLAFNNTLTLADATTSTTLEVNGTARGTDYDGITTGTALLTYGGTLEINFGTSITLAGGETFDLFNIGAGGVAGSFTSVSVAGSYITGLTNTGGVWSGTASGLNFDFSQITGDLVVTSAIPEPSTTMLLTGLAAGLAAFVARRRKLSGRS